MKKPLLVCIHLCLFTYFSSGQVIYTDINPDKMLNQLTLGSASYLLDMNNDGITDYEITNSYSVVGDTTYSRSFIIADSSNEVAVDQMNLPLALTADTMINNSFEYKSTGLGVLKEIKSVFGANFSFNGNWLEGNNRYLGVRFKDNGVKKYGWVLMEMDANEATVITTIRSYAYETSGSGISAGDTSNITGFNEPGDNNHFSILSYNGTAIIKYTGPSVGPLHIKVTDISGREIKEISTMNKEVQIDLSSLTGKIGLITAQIGNEAIHRKILIM